MKKVSLFHLDEHKSYIMLEREKQIGKWYAIQVLTGHEDEVVKCCRNLLIPEKGEDVFSLRREKEIRVKGAWKTVLCATFPGYIFCITPDAESLRMRLKRVPLLTKMLKTGEIITPLRPEESILFQELGGKDHILKISIGFKEGDTVGVLMGPLSIVYGNIVRQNRHNRVAQVEITLFNEPKRIWMGFRNLRSREEARELVWNITREKRLLRLNSHNYVE